MGQTSIEWTDETWNPVVGCKMVSPGCANCYAETMGKRLAAMAKADLNTGRNPGRKRNYLDVINSEGKWNGAVRFAREALGDPMSWNKPRNVFVNSMSDLFHEGMPFEYIAAIYGVMDACECTWWKVGAEPHGHTFQVLTKRPEQAVKFYAWIAEKAKHTAPIGPRWSGESSYCFHMASHFLPEGVSPRLAMASGKWPLPNVWLGTSVENQKCADERIPHLLKCPAAVRFLSCEPLLSDLNIRRYFAHSIHCEECPGPGMNGGRPCECPKIHWIIVGGESGPRARPMHPQWARDIRDQCQAANVPFFFKQWGEWATVYDRDVEDPDWRRCGEIDVKYPYPHGQWHNLAGGHGFHGERVVRVARVGKKAAGRLLDGREWNEMPAVLQVNERVA